MAKILSFLVCFFITLFSFLEFKYQTDNFFHETHIGHIFRNIQHEGFWYISLFVNLFTYNIVMGDFFTRLFNNWFYRRDIAKEQKKQELQRIREQDREIEKKRRELELEFDHLQKIMILQSNIDQGKMNALQDMQNSLKSQKMSDLELLRQQIERMKKG